MHCWVSVNPGSPPAMASSGSGCTHRHWGRAPESPRVGQPTGEPQGKHRASHGDAPHNGNSRPRQGPRRCHTRDTAHVPTPPGAWAQRPGLRPSRPPRGAPVCFTTVCRRRTGLTQPRRRQPEQQVRLRSRSEHLTVSAPDRCQSRTSHWRTGLLAGSGGYAVLGWVDGRLCGGSLVR